MEYYDFFIYGTAAALVFGRVFFPDADPAAGTLLALSTFGVGYISRPLGGVLLGHLGDRVGRKRVMVLTLLMMGLSALLIGCLPSYETAGLAAPIMLVALRLLQGLSAGGEQASANSMSLEHAPDHRRAFFTSFTLSGTQAGQIIATAVFLPVAALPEEQLLTWGWRVPFWGSVIMVVVGYVVRRKLEETPVFQEQVQGSGGTRQKLPLVVLLRDHWRAVVRVIVLATIASVSTIFTVYSLNYAVNTVGLAETPMLWVGVVANIVAVLTIPLWAVLSDRIGRKPVFIVGSAGSALLIFAYLGSIASGVWWLIVAMGVLMFGIVYQASNAVWPSFYAEMFPAHVRMSGVAIGTQVGFAIAGFLPTIATAVAGTGHDAWLGVSIFTAVLCLINVVAVTTGKETHRVPTVDLGHTADRTEAQAAAGSTRAEG